MSNHRDLFDVIREYDEGLYTEREVAGIAIDYLLDAPSLTELWQALPPWVQRRVQLALSRRTARASERDACGEEDDPVGARLLRLRREIEALGTGSGD